MIVACQKPGRGADSVRHRTREVWARSQRRGEHLFVSHSAAVNRKQIIPALGVIGALAAASPTSTAEAAKPSLTASAASHHVLLGGSLVVRGRASGRVPGALLKLQRRNDVGQWRTIARSRLRAKGRFVLRWHVKDLGRRAVRVAMVGGRADVGRVVTYRRALASWFGPGLYGGPLACGGRLRPGTLGVANKALPCGTKLTVRFRGRSVRVRVVDRGPYVGDREFDLTGATRNRLHFDGVGTVLVSR